ncbi:MAG: phosphatase PAP2 family protein [Gemmatimonadaceae bacterium]
MIWLVPALSAAAFLGVAWIARPLVERLVFSSTVAQWDTMVLEWFRAQSTPQLDRFFYAFTLLGTPTAMIFYALGGVSFLMKRRQWSLIYCWDTVFIGTVALTISLKNMFHRGRPSGAERFLTSASFGFPSTHAVSAVACFGAIAYVLTKVAYTERDQRAIVIIVATLFILLMGISRLYLGVHYLSDVVTGFVVGGAWLAVCLWSLKRFGQQLATVNTTQSKPK